MLKFCERRSAQASTKRPDSNMVCIFTLNSTALSSFNKSTITTLRTALSKVAGGGAVSAHARPNSTEVAAFVSGGTINTNELCSVLAVELPRRLPPGMFGQVSTGLTMCSSAS